MEDKEKALEVNLKKKSRISFDKGNQWDTVQIDVRLVFLNNFCTF